jgi:hypothetical protein
MVTRQPWDDTVPVHVYGRDRIDAQ